MVHILIVRCSILPQNTQEEKQLIQACIEGDLKTVKRLSIHVTLKNVNNLFSPYFSLLHYAARLVMKYWVRWLVVILITGWSQLLYAYGTCSYQRVGRLYIWMAPTWHTHWPRWNGSELQNATFISPFRHITGSTSLSLPYKTLIVCKIHGYNDIQKLPHPRFKYFVHLLSLLQTTYLKIGASILSWFFHKTS